MSQKKNCGPELTWPKCLDAKIRAELTQKVKVFKLAAKTSAVKTTGAWEVKSRTTSTSSASEATAIRMFITSRALIRGPHGTSLLSLLR